MDIEITSDKSTAKDQIGFKLLLANQKAPRIFAR